jgi:hypothetical protein
MQYSKSVGVAERLQQAGRHRHGHFNRERPFTKPLAKRLAKDVLHGDKCLAIDFPSLEKRGDAGML